MSKPVVRIATPFGAVSIPVEPCARHEGLPQVEQGVGSAEPWQIVAFVAETYRIYDGCVGCCAERVEAAQNRALLGEGARLAAALLGGAGAG